MKKSSMIYKDSYFKKFYFHFRNFYKHMFIFKTINSIHSNQIYFNLIFTRNKLVHVYFSAIICGKILSVAQPLKITLCYI